MSSKIIYLVSSLRKSGPIIVLHNIVTHLSNKNDVVIIKMYEDEKERSITNNFQKDGFKIYELHKRKLDVELFPQSVAREIEKILIKENARILHTHGYQSALVASKLKLVIPKIETLHCISGEDFIIGKGRILGTYMNWRYLHALKKFDACAAISETIRNYYVNKIGKVPVEVIPNGVTDVPISKEKKKNIRKRLSFPEDKTIFVSVGGLHPIKDPITIIHAFKKAFPTKDSDNMLIFLGKGPIKKECEEAIDGDERIILVGWVQDVYDYMKASDWMISASHSEGFGLSVIESLICETPIITTDINVFKEFASRYPVFSEFQFKPGCVEKLSELLKKAKHAKIEMAPIAKDVGENFSSMQMTKNYETLYRKICESYLDVKV